MVLPVAPEAGDEARRQSGGGLKPKVGGHLKATPGGAIARPGQLFAICGVIVLVGVHLSAQRAEPRVRRDAGDDQRQRSRQGSAGRRRARRRPRGGQVGDGRSHDLAEDPRRGGDGRRIPQELAVTVRPDHRAAAGHHRRPMRCPRLPRRSSCPRPRRSRPCWASSRCHRSRRYRRWRRRSTPWPNSESGVASWYGAPDGHVCPQDAPLRDDGAGDPGVHRRAR